MRKCFLHRAGWTWRQRIVLGDAIKRWHEGVTLILLLPPAARGSPLRSIQVYWLGLPYGVRDQGGLLGREVGSHLLALLYKQGSN